MIDGADIESARARVSANSLDVISGTIVLPSGKWNATNEFIVSINVVHDYTVSAILRVVADARFGHIEISFYLRRVCGTKRMEQHHNAAAKYFLRNGHFPGP